MKESHHLTASVSHQVDFLFEPVEQGSSNKYDGHSFDSEIG